MTALLIYTGKVAALLTVFYLFYKLLLSRETFHRFNRRALLGSLLAAALLPLCIITVHRTTAIPTGSHEPSAVATGQDRQQAAESETSTATVTTDSPVAKTSPDLWLTVLFTLYLCGVIAALLRTGISVFRVSSLIRNGQHHFAEDGQEIVVVEQATAPFSWFQWIVLSVSDFESCNPFILSHERAHQALGHSTEVLLAELFCDLQWFNPAAWLLKRELRAIHEYEADDAVLSAGANAKAYQLALVHKALVKGGYAITNNFQHSILKNRIAMMTQNHSPKSRKLRILALLPLLLVFLAANARTVTEFQPGISSPGFAPPVSRAKEENRTIPVSFKLIRGDAIADTLFLYVRLYAPYEIDELYPNSPIWFEDLPTILDGRFYCVALDAEASCPAGLISDICGMMREKGLRRVRYTCPDRPQDAVHRLLPPAGVPDETDSQGKDIFLLQINSRGRLRFNGKDITSYDVLENAVTAVIRQQPQNYLIHIQTDRAAPFGAFIETQQAVANSINVLRGEYARLHFGKSYDKPWLLTEEEMQEIQQYIPRQIHESNLTRLL